MSGIRLTPQEQLEVFGEGWDPDYQREAEERWGDTDAWAQSQERTATFTKEDWQQVKADTDAFNARLVDAFGRGVQPGSPEGKALAEEHLAALNTFYDADHGLQRQIVSLFTDDERFRATYEALAPGLAAWVRQVVETNADQQG